MFRWERKSTFRKESFQTEIVNQSSSSSSPFSRIFRVGWIQERTTVDSITEPFLVWCTYIHLRISSLLPIFLYLYARHISTCCFKVEKTNHCRPTRRETIPRHWWRTVHSSAISPSNPSYQPEMSRTTSGNDSEYHIVVHIDPYPRLTQDRYRSRRITLISLAKHS